MTCDYCLEPIETDETYYELPMGVCLHEDCLRHWAENFKIIKGFDDDD